MVKTPVRSIIASIDAAAARWTNREFGPRIAARNAAAARTGYALPVIDYAFDQLFGRLQRNAIEAVVVDELGSLDVLDDYVERHGRPRSRALGLGRIGIISSRTTIGVALAPAIFALCAKCAVLVKDREDSLVAAFFDSLAAELPALRDAAIAQTWRGNDEAAALHGFDAIVAFGSDATLAQIAGALPYPTRFIGYGSKAGAGYVTREALCDEAGARRIARGAALDLMLYESEGCSSLHALFVEDGGAVPIERFAEFLTEAASATAIEFPAARRDVATACALASARELATFRGTRSYSRPQSGYLAILDPPSDEPPLFLPGSIGIRRVGDPAEAAAYLDRHGITLEVLAVAQLRQDVLDMAARAGAARVARFGSLQAPALSVFHGSRPRIAEFVRWICDET